MGWNFSTEWEFPESKVLDAAVKLDFPESKVLDAAVKNVQRKENFRRSLGPNLGVLLACCVIVLELLGLVVN